MKNSVLYEICVLTSTVEEGRITEGKPETYQPAHRKTANMSASVKVVRPNNGPTKFAGKIDSHIHPGRTGILHEKFLRRNCTTCSLAKF
jgi:hypothetical protein